MIASYLNSHLPAPPSRLLVVGCPQEWFCERLQLSGREIQWVNGIEAVDQEAGAFQGILWNASDPSQSLPAVIQGARSRLTERGTLIAVTPVLANNDQGSCSDSGFLPSKDEDNLRRILRWLSETGFSVQRSQRLVESLPHPPGLECAGASAAWSVVVARKDPFLIRSYRDGDEDKILRLFWTCFQSARRLDHWLWKYAENPYGQHQISLAFSPLGELAAHYAGYSVPYWLGDESSQHKCLALHMGDTMTNPSFRQIGSRRSGLLARTVQHFFALRRGGNFGFFFGFNTGPIQRFSEWFIGGERLDPVCCWTRDLDTSLPWTEDGLYRIERIHRVGSAWDRFFRRVAPHYRFLIRRDARYLRWRYLGCPDAEYVVLGAQRWGRLVGWSVFRRLEDRLVWGDALVDPRHSGVARSLLAATRRYPQLAGVGRLEAWFSERPAWWKQQLLELDLTAVPEPQGLTLMALPDKEEVTAARLRSIYYTMGDGDLF